MSGTVAPQEKFEPLADLPPSFVVGKAEARRIVPADAPAFAAIIADDPDIRKYVTWASMVHDPNDVVPALQSRSNAAMVGRYALVHKNPIDGYIGIFPGTQEGEYGMGFFLDKSARRSELAGEALTAMVDLAKTVLSPDHLYLQIALDNKPSIALAARHGFQPAETLFDTDLNLEEQRFRLEVSGE